MYIEAFLLGIKTRLFIILMSLSLSIYGYSYNQANSYFEHLVEVNNEWFQHKEVCPKGTVIFSSDLDRIQLHLHLVIDYLQSNRPANLNSSQLANRVYLLARLQEYADKKVFPVNKYHTTRQPYFVDDLGTNCAVGQMIYLSGYKHLVAKISEAHNYDYLADIKTKGIKAWANEFGFTLNELKWIQPNYAPSRYFAPILDGTNGPVSKIEYNFFNGSLTIAGEFTELNNLPCLNIGSYKDNQLTCLSGGVDGIIHDLVHLSGEIYVFGELNHNGEVFPGAKYDGTSWNYISIPNRKGAICTSAIRGGSTYQLAMAISHPSIPEHQEIWHISNSNTWKKIAKVKGVILDITGSQDGLAYVGHLDTVTVYDTNGAIDTTLVVNNVLFKSYWTDRWFGTDDHISDTVNVAVNIGGALILGGTCNNLSGSDNICISRYFNSTLQPLFINHSTTERFSVNTIAYTSGNEFVFGGNFEFRPIIGIHGSNLATYNLVANSMEAIAVFDSTVNTISYLNGELFVGGSFQSNLRNNEVKFLAREATGVGIDEFSSDQTLHIFPNPFSTSIHVKGIENGLRYFISSIDGRLLKHGKVLNEKIDDLDFLPNGIFLLRLESANGPIVKKIIK